MSDGPAGLGAGGGGAFPRPEGGPGPRVLERLGEAECLLLIGAGRLGRLACTGRFGPTVLPVRHDRLGSGRAAAVRRPDAGAHPEVDPGAIPMTGYNRKGIT
jgi:hypothetical protein